ncbi:tripartite tricarboxylate transporter substrate binding protein [Cytobacillus depressus]|uniref:Tripartite tricarboxylate transporter substrate binding protein n=1 Tax=Cytobacillus depressus TaxID=1602942 RepID=A0A6L3V096_9BACI|nr:tripartite tricarboxylate transporter substrate binding protein [Cytobacillus depressus]KAB2330468.1 tripartite tricarboxylate transporter substrate binding protein [Cytobacillus depressus]
MKKPILFRVTLFCVLMIFLVGCSNKENQTEKASSNAKDKAEVKLDGNVELIVPASAGGGSDINARMLAEVIKENKIVDKNIMVVNKPGGSTAIANSYTFSKKGANNTVLTWNSSQLISPLLNNNDVTIDDLTPLGTLTLDSYLFVVKADNKYQTLDDIVKAAKEKPQTISIGGTGQGTEIHILSHLINKYGDTEFKYVPFDSDGETISSLLGGHINVVLSNPNEVLSQIEAGKLKALASSSEERLSGVLKDVPTFEELGYGDIKLTSFRGYVGPPGMSEEEIAYWEDVLKQVHEAEKWQKDYIEKNDLQPRFMNAEESKEFYKEVLNLYVEASKEMGLIKK